MLTKLFLSALILLPVTSTYAQDMQLFRRAPSCRARAVDRYYCPSFGGNYWQGPYFDNGCSVKCKSGQRAHCEEASCDDRQTGRPVDSRCYCD